MVNIPAPKVDAATLAQWYAKRAELAKLAQEEHFLRMMIFGHYFPAPVEGTNTFVLPDLYQLKAKYSIYRKIDEAALAAWRTPNENNQTRFQQLGLSETKLIRWAPDVNMKEYRVLTEEERKTFDTILEIKPGSPQMEIVPPAKRGANTQPSPEPVPPTGQV